MHCSAGIGRTGTVVCTDLGLHCIDSNEPLSVLDVFRAVRAQRLHSVQMEVGRQFLFIHQTFLQDQYKFIYLALLDYIATRYFLDVTQTAQLREFAKQLQQKDRPKL